MQSPCARAETPNAQLQTSGATAAGIAECRRRFPADQLVVLWLGSSIGNLAPAEAVQFFHDMTAGAGSNIQVSRN